MLPMTQVVDRDTSTRLQEEEEEEHLDLDGGRNWGHDPGSDDRRQVVETNAVDSRTFEDNKIYTIQKQGGQIENQQKPTADPKHIEHAFKHTAHHAM